MFIIADSIFALLMEFAPQWITKIVDEIINLFGKQMCLKHFGSFKYKKLIWKSKIIPC